jgi:hypothetical protein
MPTQELQQQRQQATEMDNLPAQSTMTAEQPVRSLQAILPKSSIDYS